MAESVLPDPSRELTISTKRFAQILGISDWAIYNQVRNGCSPVEAIRVGKSIRFSAVKVLELLGVAGTSGPSSLSAAPDEDDGRNASA